MNHHAGRGVCPTTTVRVGAASCRRSLSDQYGRRMFEDAEDTVQETS
ncbi:hypothetical protein [Micromonospora violae]